MRSRFALGLLLLAAAASPAGAARPTTLVIFEVEDAAPGGSLARAQTLTSRARLRVGAEQRFRVPSPAKIDDAIRAAGRRRCTFPLCQAEVLRGLGADLGLSLLVFRDGERCAVAARYFDALTRPAAPVAVRLGPCDPIEAVFDAALDGLLSERPDPPAAAAAPPPPDPVSDARAKALSLAREGRALIAEGRIDEARERLSACLRAMPLPSCHRSLGVLEARAERSEAAVFHYRAYLELKPDAPDAAEVKKIIEAATP